MLKKKKIVTGLLTVVLTFNTFISFPSADEFVDIYEERASENISKGVIHEKVLKFTNEGWLNINVMRINLEDKYTSLEVLTNANGISRGDSLTNLTSKNESSDKIIGAINGDFFDTNAMSTIGSIVNNGELVTSSKALPEFASFNIDNNNIPFIDYWSTNKLTLRNNNNDSVLNIAHKNKSYVGNSVILLDKNWGDFSFGNEKHGNIVEMVILNNRVVDIRNNQKAVEIPEDGFVIAATGSSKDYILNNFSVNDSIALEVSSDPDYEKLSLAIGGGAVILKDGKIPDEFSLKVPGRNPRTSIGISKDKKEIILMTIDGRTSSYIGVTQKELAEILIDLGAYDGINLDGGGSSEMVVKGLGKDNIDIANNPSDGFERSIMNGLAVLNNSPKASLKGINIQCEDDIVFLGAHRTFDLKGYDENYNPLEVNPGDGDWTVSGVEGKFIDNKFIPETTGNGTIEVSYNGKIASIDIKVIDNPIELSISPSEMTLQKNSEVPLYVEAVNDDGYKSKIEVSDLQWTIPKNIGEIEGSTFVSSDKVAAGIIKGSFNGIDSYIKVSTGYHEQILDDFERQRGEFVSYPSTIKGAFYLSYNAKKGKRSGQLSYDFTNIDSSKATYIVYNGKGLPLTEKPDKIGLWVYGDNGNSHWLRGKLIDSSGESYNITFARNVDWKGWKFVEASIPDNAVAPLNLERLYLVETEPTQEDYGQIYVDDLTAFYKPKFDGVIPDNDTVYSDKRNVESELKNENSFRFLAHGSISNLNTILDRIVTNKIASIANTMDLSLYTNNVSEKFQEKLVDTHIVGDSGYSLTTFKNSSFIKLDNSKGSIRETDYNQWIWLLNTVKDIDTKSLFVVLPNQLNFDDKLEEKLFFDTFKDLKENKNMDVWILSENSNDDFQIKAIDGIRFVNLKSYPNTSHIDIYNDLKYMVFTVNDGYVTYEIKNMYEKE